MKCKVIKEFAGIEVGREIAIPDSAMKYMVKSGYVEVIEEEKAIDTNYKTKVVEVPKNKSGRPSKQK